MAEPKPIPNPKGPYIKLDQFEGPLDLLLHLIGKAKIEPKDIFVSQITDQYLELVRNAGTIEMESASEFLQMAATLVYIKSRSLLPERRRLEEVEEDGLTPEERLVRQLEEYKRYKEAASLLREMEAKGAGYWGKLPEEPAPREDTGFSNADVNALMHTYQKLLQKLEAQKATPPSVVIRGDGFSVRMQQRMVMARLVISPRLRFEELVSETPTREELAVTLLAVLELLHSRRIILAQQESFGEIWIERRLGDPEEAEEELYEEEETD